MSKIKPLIYLSDQYDPAINLAYEEALVGQCGMDRDQVIFYLWQNQNTVVIGRHQNPYQECNLEAMAKDNVTLIRRSSGGGAVYHDLGNLNFSFIAEEKNYSVEKQLQLILDSLKSFGIEGCFSGRNDLTVDGKKFSGNAFMSEGSISEGRIHCHHGTLLVDVDIAKMVHYLTPGELKISSKGIDSVRSRVVNLSELNPMITTDSLKEGLMTTFTNLHGLGDYEGLSSPLISKLPPAETISKCIDKYRTWDWNYKKSPKYQIENSHRYDWGIVKIGLSIKNGKIIECQINTDAIIEENFEQLAAELLENEAKKEVIAQVIGKIIQEPQICRDLSLCFGELV